MYQGSREVFPIGVRSPEIKTSLGVNSEASMINQLVTS